MKTLKLRSAAHIILMLMTFLSSSAQEIKLLKDIRVSGGTENNGNPILMTTVGDEVFFVAITSSNPSALWKTDGTSEGTIIVKDLSSGNSQSSIYNLLNFNGKLVFTVNDALHGQELWISDGTEQGTHIIKDIRPGPSGSFPNNMCVLGDHLFFSAVLASGENVMIRTDGTEQGTETMELLSGSKKVSGLNNFTAFQDHLLFTLIEVEGDSAEYGIWKTDGTKKNTEKIKSFQKFMFATAFQTIYYSIASDSLFYFFKMDSSNLVHLWASDGTTNGTVNVTKSFLKDGLVFLPDEVTIFKNELYFSSYTPSTGKELWHSDGTPNGTGLVRDLLPGTSGSSPFRFGATDSFLFFTAQGNNGREIWRTDGTYDGTFQLRDIWPGAPSSLSGGTKFTAFEDHIFFGANNEYDGTELWISDGTTNGTRLFKYRRGGDALYPEYITAAPGYFVFNGQDESGRELWVSDGTTDGTMRLKDIDSVPGHSYPMNLFAHGNQLYFSAIDEDHGRELWTSDGTEASTRMVRDIYPENYKGSDPALFQAGGDKVYFKAMDETQQYALWMTDGTSEGTKKIKHGSASSLESLLAISGSDNLLYFEWQEPGIPKTLWKADNALCTRLHDFSPQQGVSFASKWHTSIGDRLFFVLSSTSTSFHQEEIWTSDGTPEGTRSTGVLAGKGLSSIISFVPVGKLLYFIADGSSNKHELWRTDGTLEGTILLKSFATSGIFFSLTPSHNGLYFFTSEFEGVQELWKTNGTVSGTKRITRIENLLSFSVPRKMTVAGDHVFFLLSSVTSGQDLWVSDSTERGAHIVKTFDVIAHPSGEPFKLIGAGTMLYFTIFTNDSGVELWQSDGTKDGTKIVEDLYPGESSSNPGNFLVVDNRLYFTAKTPQYGEELFYIDAPAFSRSTPSNLVVYPNPATSELNVDISDEYKGVKDIYVYNLLGQKVLQYDVLTNDVNMDVSSLTPGIYIVQLDNGLSAKFIKR